VLIIPEIVGQRLFRREKAVAVPTFARVYVGKITEVL